MSHRGTLNGFTLVGSKPSDQNYPPDELEVLSFTAHQTGLDLHAVRVESLEHEVRELPHVEQQAPELLLMAGRRKTARALLQAQAGFY